MPGSELSIDQAGIAPDHALIVARGVLDHTTVTELRAVLDRVLATDARYLIADLAQVTRCDRAALPALAGAARRLVLREGWLRLVASSDAVVAALDTTDVSDLIDLYHAHNGTRDGS